MQLELFIVRRESVRRIGVESQTAADRPFACIFVTKSGKITSISGSVCLLDAFGYCRLTLSHLTIARHDPSVVAVVVVREREHEPCDQAQPTSKQSPKHTAYELASIVMIIQILIFHQDMVLDIVTVTPASTKVAEI